MSSVIGGRSYRQLGGAKSSATPDLHLLRCWRCGFTEELDKALNAPKPLWLCVDCRDVSEPVPKGRVDDIFTADRINLKDRQLVGLLKAKDCWNLSALAGRKDRLIMAHELHAHALFSLNQLAKICRLAVPTVSRHMKKNAVGGKFEPEVLSSVVYLRKLVIIQEHIPNSLVRAAVQTGTSVPVLARLSGAAETSLYIKSGQ